MAQSGRAKAQEVESTFSQPAFGQPASLDQVIAILPNGREIRPMGAWVPLAPYPFAIAVRPDGGEAAIPSIGFPFALNIIEHPDGAQPIARRMPATAAKTPEIQTHAGLAYSPDGKLLYVATGDSGQIAIYNATDWKQIGRIDLDGNVLGKKFKGSFAATVICSSSGRRCMHSIRGTGALWCWMR